MSSSATVSGAARRSDDDGCSAFDELEVVLVGAGGRSTAVAESLGLAGALVRVVPSLADARRCAAGCDRSATVLVDLPASGITKSVRANLQELSQRGAVVLVSDDATTAQRIELLRGGVDSVLGSGDPDEAVAVLCAILRRARRSMPRVTSPTLYVGRICLHTATRTATSSGRPLVLTPLEFDLLAYFVTHAGEALSRDRLLEQVWGYQIGGRDTVTVHVRRLRTKIETDPSRPELLQTVRGVGYRLNLAGPTVPSSPRLP